MTLHIWRLCHSLRSRSGTDSLQSARLGNAVWSPGEQSHCFWWHIYYSLPFMGPTYHRLRHWRKHFRPYDWQWAIKSYHWCRDLGPWQRCLQSQQWRIKPCFLARSNLHQPGLFYPDRQLCQVCFWDMKSSNCHTLITYFTSYTGMYDDLSAWPDWGSEEQDQNFAAAVISSGLHAKKSSSQLQIESRQIGFVNLSSLKQRLIWS